MARPLQRSPLAAASASASGQRLGNKNRKADIGTLKQMSAESESGHDRST
ncbi:hypothetical protein [Roseateles sp. MS654]